MVRNVIRTAAFAALVLVLALSCGCRRRKYDNPITKETQQPDKVLFDKAVKDIEKGRFDVARLTLNVLINTYDTSEYLAKAKLAIADSWYREGGSHGWAQAEAEYKDFKLFYPAMEEAAESQAKICEIHFKQLEKSDRDPLHAIRAEEECRALLTEFPNSKFAPETEQRLRGIQEVLADGERKVGDYYHTKGNYYASANRLTGVVDQFPLYSGADQALWAAIDSYTRLGDRMEKQLIASLQKMVRDYPLSPYAPDAKSRLEALKSPVPEADPVAMERMKYELANRGKIGLMSKFWGAFSAHPNLTLAAKSGAPATEGLRPTIPENVPPMARGLGTGDVTVSTPSDASALDNNPDARAVPPGQAPAAPETPAAQPPAADQAAKPAAAAAAKNQKKQPKAPKPPKVKKNAKAQAPPADDSKPKQ
jgi:outer membrane protein assembly factor BamD